MGSEAVAGEVYDDGFFDYADRASTGSALRIVPKVRAMLPDIQSVADFGCARGAWLRVWAECGVHDFCGVDGDYVDRTKLKIPAEFFVVRDLSRPVDLGRRFDIVQSLEVAEHLPEAAAKDFVGTLTAHSDVVLFSAAPPGQGGAHHVNEKPYEYWRDHFAEAGYTLLDCLRPAISGDESLQYWYRFNSFLFVNDTKLLALPEPLRKTAIARNRPIPDVSPLSFRLRKRIVARLPETVQNSISAAVSRWRARA